MRARSARRAACDNNLHANRPGVAGIPSSERLFPAGIHRRQERQADAQLAGAHTALPGSRCSLQGLRLHRTLGRAEEQEALGLTSQGVCLPERPQCHRARCYPDKLCRRGGTERRLGGREVEEARRISARMSPTRSCSSKRPTRASPGRSRGTCRWTRWERPTEVDSHDALSSNHRHAKEFFFTYDYGTGVNVAMADGSVRFLRTDWPFGRGLAESSANRRLTEETRIRVSSTAERHLNWPNIAALAVWLLSVGMLLTHAVRSRKVLPVPPPPS